MSDDAPFDDLMQRLRGGDEQAAQDIFQRFARRLIGLARKQLDGKLRAKVDPEDVAQSALRSFFVHHAEGQYELDNWDALWSLLTVITLRKCGYQTRHFRTAGRDVRREQSPRDGAEDDSSSSFVAISGEPTPSEAYRLAETVEILLREMDERDRPILLLGLQGLSTPEISAQIGRAERTVYRALERIRVKLQAMRNECEGGS
jgi:RNA polymerase sigma-70 factor (ECF subfamily)